MNDDKSTRRFYQGPVSDHFDGKLFFNPWARVQMKGFLDVLKWQMQGTRSKWPERVKNPARPAPVERSGPMKVTFIGHATVLIQVGQINLLVDPVFSERCSPFKKIGPRRVRAPFVPLEKLPPIDIVFVSHNHYDHMDMASLAWLDKHHAPVIYTPLGNERLISPHTPHCSILPLDWHQTASLGNGLNLTVTPAQHWSRRTYSDTCRDLWSGFVLKQDQGSSVYFCGDTGFHQGMFEDIKARHGAPDIAILPIGAYEPRWFMEYSHMNPDDMMKAFRILGARKGMAIHFETFQLTDEAIGAPRARTEELLLQENVQAGDFVIPVPGDFVQLES